MKRNQQPLILIVGMHRSGTSAVGHLLEKMGFEFGNNLLEGIRSVNDEGFWEDKEVVALNEHIFDLFDFRWFDFERLPGKWWEDARIKDLVGVAETWHEETFSGENPIAVKDPRFCRLLPFWKRVFQGLGLPLKILFVFRHPTEVAASLQKRDTFSWQLGYLLWLSYTIDGLYYSRNLDLSLLHYGDLVKDPDKTLKKLCETGIFSPILNVDDTIKTAVAQSLDASRQHQKSNDILPTGSYDGDIQRLALELYDELLVSNPDEAKGLADKYRKRLYRLLDHHGEILVALQDGVRNQVKNNQKLFKIGEEHSHALAVIREKDEQLNENKQFIERCLAEIKNKEILLQSSSLDTSAEIIQSHTEKFDNWMAALNRLVEDYRENISEQKQYIAECEEKLASQQQGLADNQEYIAKCHARIAEQDAGIAENRGYIYACEERIRVQDEGLSIRDKNLEEKIQNIADLKKQLARGQDEVCLSQNKIVELEKFLQTQQDCLAEKNQELEENKQYVVTCRAEISERDSQLLMQATKIENIQAQLEQSWEKIKHDENFILEKTLLLTDYSEKIKIGETNLANALVRLAEQEKSLLEQQYLLGEYTKKIKAGETNLANALVRLAEQEKTLSEQQRLLGEYTGKIKMGEIALQTALVNNAELEQSLFEKNARIQELVLVSEENATKISAQEQFIEINNKKLTDSENENSRLMGLDQVNRQRLALQKQQFEKLKAHTAALESELAALRAESNEQGEQLQRYRSYRIVKIIDRLFPEIK